MKEPIVVHKIGSRLDILSTVSNLFSLVKKTKNISNL